MAFRATGLTRYSGVSEYYIGAKTTAITRAYYITFRDVDNTMRRVKTDAGDRDEALGILNRKKAEIVKAKKKIAREGLKAVKTIVKGTRTLDQMAELYYENRKAIDNTSDQQKYENRVSPMLGSKRVSRITTKDIKALQEKLEETYSNKTVNEQINSMRALFNTAIGEKWAEDNPVIRKSSRTPNGIEKLEESKIPGRVLSVEETKILWEIDELKMNDRLSLFLKVCYYTGARPDGVISLKVKDLDFSENKVTIKAMKKGPPYKASMHANIKTLLEDWIDKHNLTHDNCIFFPIQSFLRATTEADKEKAKNKHANYSGYRRLIQKILDPVFNVGIDATQENKMYRITIYSLRRTAATRVYQKYGIKHAQKFLSHTDIVTTVKYLNIDADMEEVGDAL